MLTRILIFFFFSAVTFGAGVQWYEAYDYIDGQGRFVVGGLSQGGSVGSAGGWVMGGGHSAFSPSLGLGKALPTMKEFQQLNEPGTFSPSRSRQCP